MYWHKYGYDPAYGELLQNQKGQNNYELGAYWFDRSRRLIWEGRPLSVFHPRVADSGVFHCCLLRYEQILRQGTVGPEGFDRETLDQAEPWRKRSLDEVLGLMQRWPDDAVFPTFQARVDLTPAEAYIFLAGRAMLAGGLSQKNEPQAMVYLDLARKELDRVAAAHQKPVERTAVEYTRSRLQNCLPFAYLQEADIILTGQAYPPRDKVRQAVEWIARAKELLRSTPLGGDERRKLDEEIEALLKRGRMLLETPPPPSAPEPR
jgi:hypothetical protein